MKKIAAILALTLIASPAMAMTQERNASWIEYIQWANQRSAEQHNGKPLIHRECNARQGFCFMSVEYVDNKSNIVQAVEYTNKDNLVYKRTVNRFNQYSDGVVSVNWDTMETVQQMMDTNTKEWITVK